MSDLRSRLQLRSPRAGALAVPASLTGYPLLFLLAYPLAGSPAVMLASLPVIWIAWIRGVRAGLLCGLASLPLNALLLDLVGEPGWTVLTQTRGGLMGSVFLMLLGLVVGRMSDLRRETDRELAARCDAEARLSENEARLRLQGKALEAAVNAIVITDREGTILWVNHAFTTLTGYGREEVVGQHTRLLKSGKQSADFYRELWGMVLAGEVWHGQIVNRRKDGSEYIEEMTITPLRDAGDEISHFIAIKQDVTERRRVQAELQEAEAKYRSLVEGSLAGVYLIQRDRFVYVNRQLAEFLGYAPEEIIGKMVTDLIAPDSRAQVAANMRNRSSGEVRSQRYTFQAVRKDGEVVVIEVFGSRTMYLGEPALIGTALDITERKRAVEALREADRRAILQYEKLLERLARLAQVVGTASDLLTVYRGLHEFAEVSVPCDGICVSLFDAERELRTCTYLGRNGIEDDLSRLPPMPMDDSPQGRAIASGKPVIVHHLRSAHAQAGPFLITRGPNEDPRLPRSSLAMPLLVMDRVIGALEVQSALPAAYTPADVTAMRMAANLAAIATENVLSLDRERYLRLRAEASEAQSLVQLGRLNTLRRIDQAITSTLEPTSTLSVLLDHVTTQLGVDAADILLLDRASQRLEYAAGRGFRTRALQHTRLRLGEGYAGWAAAQRRVVTVTDLQERRTDFLRSPLFAEEGFATCHAVPLIARDQVVGVLEVFHRAPIDPDPDWLAFLQALAVQAAIAIDNASLFNQLQRSTMELELAYDTTLEGWSRALDLRDKETEGHTQRVTELTLRLAKALGISDAELVDIRRGGLLHDIGKMGIPDEILNKPGPLTETEWELMWKHPVHAYELLSPIGYLQGALDIPYCHHEKWDGTGYPRGLAGTEIPLAARIFAVSDVYDALLSDRPYRQAWPFERVVEYVKGQAGKHFDPQVVELFLARIDEWRRELQPAIAEVDAAQLPAQSRAALLRSTPEVLPGPAQARAWKE